MSIYWNDNTNKDNGKKCAYTENIFVLQEQNISEELRGDEDIREILEGGNKTTVLCGHMHWKKPLVTLTNESQVLNVDSRVIILINRKAMT